MILIVLQQWLEAGSKLRRHLNRAVFNGTIGIKLKDIQLLMGTDAKGKFRTAQHI